MSREQVADFTTTGGENQAVCQRCKLSFPPGTQLFYMQDRNPTKQGKYLCSGCRTYHVEKSESILRTRERVEDLGNIQRDVAAARREGSSHPKRIGHSQGQYDHRMPPPPVPLVSNRGEPINSITLRQPWPSRQNNQQLRLDGPKIFTPGHSAQTLDVPDFFTGKPPRPGYQEAHKMYDEMRNHFARRAYASNNFELVVVKVTMMWMKPGNKNPSIVSNISETVNNVPVHIGVQDLKTIAFLTLRPLFLKWSKDYFISIDEVRLRNKDWVEMVPILGAPDVDAIARKFFVAKGKARNVQFHAGKGIEVFLELEHEKYQQIFVRLEELADNALEASTSYIALDDHSMMQPALYNLDDKTKEPASAHENAPQHSTQQITVKTRKRQHSVQKSPPLTPRSKRLAPSPTSPSVDDVRRALQAQKAPSKKAVKSVLNTISIPCMIYPTSPMTFASLVANARPFGAITDCGNPARADLIFDPNASPKYGGFKKAMFGHTSTAMLGHSAHVCIKQCWYECKATGARLTFDNPTQVTKLSSEINCLRWASALMGLVYAFIAEQTKSRGKPPFEIPSMRFVSAALAVAETGNHNTYMIEEVIDEALDGQFVKYIGNGSAIPYTQVNSAIAHRADFLAFCQHIQYSKTKELAFVGDFQGGQSLLTDPQIITAAETGQNFADGNLASTIEMFSTDHICNQFCTFFGLQHLPTKVPSATSSSARAHTIKPVPKDKLFRSILTSHILPHRVIDPDSIASTQQSKHDENDG